MGTRKKDGGKRKVGRPSDLTPAILKKTTDYIKNYEDYDHVIPSITGLAEILHKPRQTIYRWAKDKKHNQFSDTLEQILCEQELVLFRKGLSGEFNSSLCILMLANHGYSKRQRMSGFEQGSKLKTPQHIDAIDDMSMEEATRIYTESYNKVFK